MIQHGFGLSLCLDCDVIFPDVVVTREDRSGRCPAVHRDVVVSGLCIVLRLCELNPKGRLQQSNPKSYDNHSTLIENIRINKTREFQDIVESRGIVYILTSRFLEAARPKSSSKDERIRIALNYIRKNIGNKIMVKELADSTSLSMEHFIRLFKKETGETPNMYITRVKMERAMVLLATSNANIKSIALTLGYDDLSYFTRTFKRFSGVSPQRYRDQHFTPAG